VTVTDGAGRSDTAVVTATVQSIDKPLILITSQSVVGKFNKDNQLTLNASIELPPPVAGSTVSVAGSYLWSVNDTSVNLGMDLHIFTIHAYV
jgi:hypothetical protein